MRSILAKTNRGHRGFAAFEDVLYALVFMFASALLLFMLYYIFGQIKAPIGNALDGAIPGGETSFNSTQFGDKTQGGVLMFNGMFPFLMIGLIIMTCISALFLESHPAFFFVSIILLGVMLMLTAIFSNIYQTITESPEFGDTDTVMNVIQIFMKYLPMIALVLIVIVMIIIFGRAGGSSGGGGL